MFRVSEIYRSVQGEGPNVGTPTLFVRFGGCNLRCPGWACDTQHAIDVKYRKSWMPMDVDELGKDIMEMSAPTDNVCFTGGEPFLQSNSALKELVVPLSVSRKLECFTNGTLGYPTWAMKRIQLIIDCKLPGAGEKNINANVVRSNLHMAWKHRQYQDQEHVMKFTVADAQDFATAYSIWEELKNDKRDLPVFVAPVWGKVEPADLVQWVLDADLPWRLNLQSHKYIWPADKRGV